MKITIHFFHHAVIKPANIAIDSDFKWSRDNLSKCNSFVGPIMNYVVFDNTGLWLDSQYIFLGSALKNTAFSAQLHGACYWCNSVPWESSKI